MTKKIATTFVTSNGLKKTTDDIIEIVTKHNNIVLNVSQINENNRAVLDAKNNMTLFKTFNKEDTTIGYAMVAINNIEFGMYDSTLEPEERFNNIQRGLNGKDVNHRFISQVKELAASFDIRQYTPIILTYDEKTGKLKCIDGNHRIVAAILMGYYFLPAFIIIDLTNEDKNYIYAIQGNNSTKMSAIDRYIAFLGCEDKGAAHYAHVIHNVLSAKGYSVRGIDGNEGDVKINAFTTLMRIAKNLKEPELFKEVIDLLDEGFGLDDQKRFGRWYLEMAYSVAVRCHNNPDYHNKMVEYMQRFDSCEAMNKYVTGIFASEANRGKNGEGFLVYAAKVVVGLQKTDVLDIYPPVK